MYWQFTEYELQFRKANHQPGNKRVIAVTDAVLKKKKKQHGLVKKKGVLLNFKTTAEAKYCKQ